MRTTDAISTLVDSACCPRCGRTKGVEAESFRGFSTCYAHQCGQRWWTMLLQEGDVVPQLAEVFGDELALTVARTWNLPIWLARPMYWQLRLSLAQYETHSAGGSGWLLEALVALFRSRSINR